MNSTLDHSIKQYSRHNSSRSSRSSGSWDVFQPTVTYNDDTETKKQAVLIEWMNSILPNLNLPVIASPEELRARLIDGTVLLQILSRLRPGSVNEGGGSAYSAASGSENVKKFLSTMDELGIVRFEISDLEKGSMKPVIDCLLSLRAEFWRAGENVSVASSISGAGSSRGHPSSRGLISQSSAEEKRLEAKFQQTFRSPAFSEQSTYQGAHKFHEVFQLKQGRYADLSAAKISEMMKSNSLDNAPTQSLLSVVNGILDESIERNNGEIPQRVACLLRKVVQEIERRISTQAEHLRTQNNLFKAREEKYQSRIKVLETLASGTGEETGIVMEQLQQVKILQAKMEERKKVEEDLMKLVKEKEQKDLQISALKQELEMAKMSKKEERKQVEKNDLIKLLKEKEQKDIEIAALKQELEISKNSKKDERKQVEENDLVKLLKEKQQKDIENAALKQELEISKNSKNDERKHVEVDDLEKLLKEQELKDLEILALRQELEMARKSKVEERKKVEEDGFVDLIKEKEERDLEILALKQELEITKKSQIEGRKKVEEENSVKWMKEKEQKDLQLLSLKQELEIAKMSKIEERKKVEEESSVKWMKEKELKDLELSSLKQELEIAKMSKMEDMKQVEEANLVKWMKENEQKDVEICALKQELETAKKSNMEEMKKVGEENLIKRMKEQEQKELEFSALKQELEIAKKSEVEEMKKAEEENLAKWTKEKQQKDLAISVLKQELEMAKKTHELHCLHIESEAKAVKAGLEGKLKELEYLFEDSRNKVKVLEEDSESKCQKWKKKEQVFGSSVEFQLGALQELRLSSETMKKEIFKARKSFSEEFDVLGINFKMIANETANHHLVLAENRKMYNELQDLKGNIRVYCRIRPFLPGDAGKQTIIDHIGGDGELIVANPSKQGKDGHRLFRFNKVYGPDSTQGEVYTDTQPLIRSVLDGFNVCIFAYGQTGSGKTYTMTGPNGATEEEWGVNYRALNDLFKISQNRSSSFTYEVGVQMIEIYNEQVRDLLSSDGSNKKLGIVSGSQRSGLTVPDAAMLPVTSTSDVMKLMDTGLNNRAVSATAMNERSSRSHSVVSIHVRGKDLKSGATLFGNLHLVDLAGSERIDRSEVTGDRLREAQHINKSLAALGDVIFALAQKSAHIPYRNSKLTQLLQSSLGGQAKTLMFVQLNPDVTSYSETMSTLKFAERVSGVELGAAKSTKEGRDVKELMEQVASLKDMIAKKDDEIERLHVLKDLKPNFEKNGTGTTRFGNHSPSNDSVGRAAQQSESPSGGKGLGLAEKAGSQHDNNGSEPSDGDREADELLRYEEGSGDMSDAGFSAGTEPEGFLDEGKKSSDKSPKNSKVASKVRTFQKAVQAASALSGTKDLKRSSSLKKSSSNSTLLKPARKWQ